MNIINILEERLEIPSVGTVIIFSGHMIDSQNRIPRRFPDSGECRAADAIRNEILALNARIGYSSAACGGDILFLEAMQNLGAETHVFIPFLKQDFIRTSVGFSNIRWVDRFESILLEATTVTYSTREYYQGNDILFKYCNDCMREAALRHAVRLETEAIGLLLLEEYSENEIGGTGDMFLNSLGGLRTVVIPRERMIWKEETDTQS